MSAKRHDLIERSIYRRTQGFYAVSSWLDIFYLLGPWIVGVALLFMFPVLCGFDPYFLNIFATSGIYAILGVSWVLLALLGLYSLGHGIYIAIPGYIIGVLNVNLHLPLYVSVALGMILGTLVIVAFHCASLRVKGPYFLLVTFLVPLMLTQTAFLFPDLLHGEEGIFGIQTLTYGPIPFVSGNYYLVATVVVFTLIAARRFINSKESGLILRCVADNEYAVEASGLSVWKYKILLFTVSSIIGNIAGVLYVITKGYIGPSSFATTVSLTPLLGSVIGTINTSLAGPVIGTYLLVVTIESLRVSAHFKIIIYAVILMAAALARPRGLFHHMAQAYQYFRRVREQ
ncbi:MAG: branched-chain amino acid ABC transporter permease [Thermodesulfobacteriota bacterium]|nr:branched-chain amino acid ABC transporter permease [Thermodesulfobacteriota bacterium]